MKIHPTRSAFALLAFASRLMGRDALRIRSLLDSGLCEDVFGRGGH